MVAVGAQYLSIVCFSYPAVTLTNVLATVLRNTERVKLPMYVSAVTTVVNAVVDYGLIFGAFGFPALGVKGAALATCISAWMGPALILLFSAFEKNLLMGPRAGAGEPSTSGSWASSAAGRMPVVCNEGLWAVGTLVLNMTLLEPGLRLLRRHDDLPHLLRAGLLLLRGAGQRLRHHGGQERRAGQDPAGRPGRPAVFGAACPWPGLVIGGLTILFRYPLISLFATGDNLSAVTMETALAVTIFCSIEVIFRNVSYVQVVGVFRSGGDTLRGMIYDLTCLWLVSIPLTLLAAHVLHLPFLGVVMVAYLGEDVPKAILCLRHFKSLKWLMPVTEEGRSGLEEYRRQLMQEKA